MAREEELRRPRGLRSVIRSVVAIVGGADPTRGSGLIGIIDRVQAIGGSEWTGRGRLIS
jgi:hypothetical protein